MNNELDSLVSGINGTTGLLTRLISQKSGLVLFLVIGTVIVVKLAF
jgi:hypothetical protein